MSDGLFSALELDGPTPARVGWRLHRVEVLNWGTFDGRVWTLRLEGENTLLTIVVDHTVSDGWSLALLVRRFAMAHRLLRAGKPLELRPLGGFADFLDRLPDAPTRRRNLDRWRELLADTTPPGPPTLFEKDGPDPDRAFLLDTHHVFPVEPRATRAANVLAQRYGTNPAEIWVAAAILAATRNSRGPQPSITMHHGRTRRADFRVFGPLTEAHVTPAVPADRGPSRLRPSPAPPTRLR